MNKPNLSNISKGIQSTFRKHGPEILTGIGIAGMITTTVMAVKATPKALILIENAKMNNEIGHLTPVEVIKETWSCYIPAALTGCVSILCLIGASSANVRRNAALATAYALSESALREYQEKVVEIVGEKKEQAVRDAIAKDIVEKNPVSSREIIITDKGGTLCYDALSGRYFKSDIDKLKKAANELNRSMLNEMYVSLNDFYFEIGLSSTRLGDTLGWNIDDGFLELNFSTTLAEDGTPCIVLDYRVAPKYDYRR